MKVVTYNIQWGLGRDRRIDLGRVVRALDGADVIALQEVEAHWKRSGDVDQASAIAALMPRYHWVYGPGFDVDASRERADGTIEHRRRRFGNMVLSRAPIRSVRVFPLRKIDNPKVGGMQTAIVEAVIGDMRIYNVHLGDGPTRERLMQIEDLLAVLAAAPVEGGAMTGDRETSDDPYADEDWSNGEAYPPMPDAAIVLGDFNAPPAGPEYDALVAPGGLVDTMKPDDGGPTWYGDPARTAEAPQRIDYVFVTADLAAAVRRAWIDQAADGSDHQPVWAELEGRGPTHRPRSPRARGHG